MSKELKNLFDSLNKAKIEAQALMSNPKATIDEINAKTAEIAAIQARIELQKRSEGTPSADSGETAETGIDDETYNANIAAINKQYPGVLDRYGNEAKDTERQRIKNIDAIAGQVAPALVNKAKYDNPMTAKDLAFKQMKNQKANGQQHLQNFADDTAKSGVKNIAADPIDPVTETDDQQRAGLGEKLANAINNKIRR